MVNVTFLPRITGKDARVATYFDEDLETGGNITIDQDDYTTLLDRVYPVKGRKNMHAEIENTGLDNGLTYRIEGASKEFRALTDLVDADFTNEIKADTNLAGGALANGTVTFASALVNVFADGTITCAGVLAGDTVTVNGLLYTGVTGAKANDTEFSVDTGNNETALDLRNSIDDDTRTGTLGDVSAGVSTNVVTSTSDQLGTAGNAVTLVSSNGTRLAVSGAGTFTGGVDADTVTVNGLVYTAVVTKTNDTEFGTANDNVSSDDFTNSVNADTRIGTLGDVQCTNDIGSVTLESTVAGAEFNAITLASSDGTRLAVSGATLVGGAVGASANDDIGDISPQSTAIRVRVKRETSGLNTTRQGIVSIN